MKRNFTESTQKSGSHEGKSKSMSRSIFHFGKAFVDLRFKNDFEVS